MKGTDWNRIRYSLYAPVYDLVVARAGFLGRGRRRALALAALRPGERLLIVGAGTGLDLPLIPAGVHVTAIDIAPAMVRRTRERARRLGRQVHAQVMDSAALAYPAASFDCVALHLVLAVVPDPVGTIRETVRVLRPGGRMSIFDKFLPDGERPSVARTIVGMVTSFLFSDINRQLGPLVAEGALRLSCVEPAGMAGLFVVARADKPTPSRNHTILDGGSDT